MRIAKSSVESYRKAVHDVGEQAARYVLAMLMVEDTTDVATLREAAIAAIMEAVGAQGEVAQALAMQVYDAICQAEGIDTKPAAMFPDLIDRSMCVEKVHYYARSLVMGARAKFDKDAAGLAEFYVRRCAYENTVRNCGANNVRYARIPTGEETCGFCFMLASRGFVYHSEASARGTHGVHRNCDCIVLPGAKGKTEIDGYDWKAMQERWAQLLDELGVDGTKGNTSFDRHAQLIKAAERHGKDWMWRGIEKP